MHNRIYDEVLNRLKQELTSKESSAILCRNGKEIPISKEKLHAISAKESSEKIAFIDGGNAELLRAPNFSLHFVRLYGSIYQGSKRIKSRKEELYLLVTAKQGESGDELYYQTEVFGSTLAFGRIDLHDPTLRTGNNPLTPDVVALTCRKFAEVNFATEMLEDLGEGDMLVLDGDLEEDIVHAKTFYTPLKEKALQRKIFLCGLSKTTRMLTNAGDSVISSLLGFAPDTSWWYDGGSICFVKLHPRAQHIFRLDVLPQQKENIPFLLSSLAHHAKDPVFLGYPYGLIEADRCARVSNNEKDYLQLRFISKLRKEDSGVIHALSALNAHDILDRVG